MKIIKLALILSLLALFSGCVSFPNTEAFDLPQGSKVGYEISLSEEITHTHYGTTVFNNLKEPYSDLNWELNSYAKSEVIRLLEIYNFSAVEVNNVLSDEDQKQLDELIKKLREGISTFDNNFSKIQEDLDNAPSEPIKGGQTLLKAL